MTLNPGEEHEKRSRGSAPERSLLPGLGRGGNRASECWQMERSGLRGPQGGEMPIRGPRCSAEHEEVPGHTGAPRCKAGRRREPRISRRVRERSGRARSRGEAVSPGYVGGRNIQKAPGSRWGQEAWERGEGGAGRGMWPLLQPGTPPPPCPPGPGTGSSYLRGRGAPGPGQPRGRAAPGAALASPPRGKCRRRGELTPG